VVVMGEKPHSAWYSGYSGVGTALAARNETTSEASRTMDAVVDRAEPRRVPEVRIDIGGPLVDRSVCSI
jgi:hypothetical protein